MARRISSKRFEEAIEAFQETLESFCEMMLPGGRRSGNKWICGDLHDGEGMEAWVQNGSLPHGAVGVVRETEVRLSDEEIIVARDSEEKILIGTIKHCQDQIELCSRGLLHTVYYDRGPRQSRAAGPRWWADPWGDPPKEYEGVLYVPKDYTEEEYAAIDFVLEKEKQIAWHLAKGRQAFSAIYAHRWLNVVAETQAHRDEFAAFMAEYRGLSSEVFCWLLDSGYIALYRSEKTSKEGNKWEDMEVAYPVMKEIQLFPDDRPRYIEFYGMHLKWFGTEKSGWRYEPKGTSSLPLVIGDLATADLVVIGESTWDVIAFIDLRKLYERGPDKPWGAIATRGAGNSAKIPDQIKSDATVVLLLQNDAANEKWYDRLPKTISTTARRIVPPTGTKDLNDWVRVAGTAGVNKVLNK